MEVFNSRFSELKNLGMLVMSCLFNFTLNSQGSHLSTHFTQGQTQQRLQEYESSQTIPCFALTREPPSDVTSKHNLRAQSGLDIVIFIYLGFRTQYTTAWSPGMLSPLNWGRLNGTQKPSFSELLQPFLSPQRKVIETWIPLLQRGWGKLNSSFPKPSKTLKMLPETFPHCKEILWPDFSDSRSPDLLPEGPAC